MKKIITTALMTSLLLTANAQKSITTFMGITVDGSVKEMRQQLLKNGFQEADKGIMKGQINGDGYFLFITADNEKVSQLALVEEKGTNDVRTIIDKYNRLIEEYRENKYYTEYEHNNTIALESKNTCSNYIHSGWYYAEFFQVCEQQEYSRRISLRISDEFGDYRIITTFDNIYNMQKGTLAAQN